MVVKTTSINASTFLAKGEIIDVGPGSVEYGFCYSTSLNPGMNDNVLKVGTSSSPQSYQATLSLLVPGSTYYLRAYIKGTDGVVLGDILKFVVPSGEIEYVFDNGVDDYAWRINPTYVGYLGNLFPVSTAGTIKAVSIFFRTATGAGSEPLYVTIFDASRNEIATTGAFIPSSGSWMSLTGLNIPYNGNFYAMVLWNNLVNSTNFLAEDQSGPQAYLDLAYHYGSTWEKVSSITSGNQLPGVFLLRVTVLLSTAKGNVLTTLGPEPGPVISETISHDSKGSPIRQSTSGNTINSIDSSPVK